MVEVVQGCRRGEAGRSDKGKNRSKKGYFTQKRPKIADEGVLEPSKPPKNKGTYDILYVLYII